MLACSHSLELRELFHQLLQSELRELYRKLGFFSLTLALVDRALAILWMTNALAWAKSTFAARLRDLNLGTRKLLSA